MLDTLKLIVIKLLIKKSQGNRILRKTTIGPGVKVFFGLGVKSSIPKMNILLVIILVCHFKHIDRTNEFIDLFFVCITFIL